MLGGRRPHLGTSRWIDYTVFFEPARDGYSVHYAAMLRDDLGVCHEMPEGHVQIITGATAAETARAAVCAFIDTQPIGQGRPPDPGFRAFSRNGKRALFSAQCHRRRRGGSGRRGSGSGGGSDYRADTQRSARTIRASAAAARAHSTPSLHHRARNARSSRSHRAGWAAHACQMCRRRRPSADRSRTVAIGPPEHVMTRGSHPAEDLAAAEGSRSSGQPFGYSSLRKEMPNARRHRVEVPVRAGPASSVEGMRVRRVHRCLKKSCGQRCCSDFTSILVRRTERSTISPRARSAAEVGSGTEVGARS